MKVRNRSRNLAKVNELANFRALFSEPKEVPEREHYYNDSVSLFLQNDYKTISISGRNYQEFLSVYEHMKKEGLVDFVSSIPKKPHRKDVV